MQVNVIAIFLILLININGCENSQGLESNISTDSAKIYFHKYLINKQNDALAKSYSFIEKVNNLNLYEKNDRGMIITIILYKKVYDHAIKLLKDFKPLDSVNQVDNILTLNLTKYLANKDELNANEYIYNNIAIIENRIQQEPLDSLAYTNLFLMKMYLNGRNKTLIQIDSMQNTNKQFSELFYESVLRDFIEEYPEELM